MSLRIPDYVAMTNAFLRNAADFLVERGGYLDECDGESLRVVFGAPMADGRHAARACECALELPRLPVGNLPELHDITSARHGRQASAADARSVDVVAKPNLFGESSETPHR